MFADRNILVFEERLKMKVVDFRLGAFALFLALTSGPCLSSEPTNDIVPVSLKSISPPIAFSVVVPHDIQIEYTPEFISTVWNDGGEEFSPSGDGLIGNLIRRLIDSAERKKSIKEGEDFSSSISGLDLNAYSFKAVREAFANISWVAINPEINSVSGREKSASKKSTIIFEYGIDPNYDRVFVSCYFEIEEIKYLNDLKNNKRNILYRNKSQTISDLINFGKTKEDRLNNIKSKSNEYLENIFLNNSRNCAINAVRQISLTSDELLKIKSAEKITVTTQGNMQFRGWFLDGVRNLRDGKFGPLGIKKTFTAPGTEGVLLLDPYRGFIHINSLEN